MKFWKIPVYFSVGGLGYVGLELLWRGRSHGSMFLAGGLCFLILGKISRRPWQLWKKGTLGALMITVVELETGLLFNRQYTVWDYRGLPMNLLGQICLPFTLLWIPVSLGAMLLYQGMERLLSGRKNLPGGHAAGEQG